MKSLNYVYFKVYSICFLLKLRYEQQVPMLLNLTYLYVSYQLLFLLSHNPHFVPVM